MKKLLVSLLFGMGVSLSASAPAHADEAAKDATVLDVRTPEEFTEGHVNGAINLDYYDESFKGHLARLDKSKNYKLYCRSGNRSSKALEIMKSMGFKQVENLGTVSQAAKALGKSCTGKAKC